MAKAFKCRLCGYISDYSDLYGSTVHLLKVHKINTFNLNGQELLDEVAKYFDEIEVDEKGKEIFKKEKVTFI